jgi:O-antigen ligase
MTTPTPDIDKRKRPEVLLAACALVAAVALAVISDPFGRLPIALAAAVGVALVSYGWLVTWRDPLWLPFMLMLFELLQDFLFLPLSVRPAISYSLTLLFCAPAIPMIWHAWRVHSSGFRLYLFYFAWSLLTVTYSIAPEYSIVRLLRTLLLFGAVVLCTRIIRHTDDVRRLIRSMMLACIAVTLANAVSAVALPRSITWTAVDQNSPVVNYVEDEDELSRFCGLFENPNAVGELTLITVGLILAYFEFATRKERLVLAVVALIALWLAGLADSRSGFVGLAIGLVLYAWWRYRFKGLALTAAVPILALMVWALAGHDLSAYLMRGDVSTLTGRTDIWPFVVEQIAKKPITGYGYDVSGAIFHNRFFPLWYAGWDEGPHTSLHNGYLTNMVDVGIPATIFWLFIMLRPWVSLFSETEDLWRIKPLFFFLVVPLLVVNLDESMVVDCSGVSGLSFAIAWALAEWRRLADFREFVKAQQAALRRLPPAIAALRFRGLSG